MTATHPVPPADSPEGGAALELIGVSKAFGGVRALDDVTFSAATGTVHALLGENGAGKSTLMRVAYGLLRPDRGRVRLFGQDLGGRGVRGAVEAGVGMVHQHLSLVPTLTVAENLALGRRGIFRPRESFAELVKLSESSGLHVDPSATVRNLGIVEQQRVEILKALARGARALILDEPTSGLAPSEIDDLLRWVRRFAHAGGTVILVTHRLREALAVADHVSVLRRGRLVRSAALAATATPEDLARAVFDDVAAPRTTAPAARRDEPVADLHSVTVVDARGAQRLRDVSMRVHRGEIVGVAAVEGAGHRELLAVLAGLVEPTGGTAGLPRRIALIPADRLRDALIPAFSLVDNVALRGAGTRRGRMPWRELTNDTRDLIERFSIVARSPEARARELSGGNQQRLVVGRELSADVDLVVADDPARGLDLRATQFVYDQLRDAAARGAGVVIHSSDLDELLDVATRMVVVFHAIVTEVPMNRELVGRAMLGGSIA